MDINGKIRTLRLDRGMTQAELAKATGYSSRGAITLMKRGNGISPNEKTTLSQRCSASPANIWFPRKTMKLKWLQLPNPPTPKVIIPSRCSFPNTKQFCIGALINFDFY